jgi:tetratricopeptide (TPR) repeat protein
MRRILQLGGLVFAAGVLFPPEAAVQVSVMQQLEARWDSANALLQQGTPTARLEARRVLNRALVVAEQSSLPHQTGLFLAVLGHLYRIDGPSDSAVIVLERALPLVRDSASRARTHSALGVVLTARDEHGKATVHFDSALGLMPRADRRLTYTIRSEIATALLETRAIERAEELYEDAYEDGLALQNPALVAHMLLHFGVLQEFARNRDSARVLYRRAVRESGGDELTIAQARMAEAESWIDQARPDLALPLYELASPVLERLGAGELTGRQHEHLGQMYSQLGRYQEALRRFRFAEVNYRAAGRTALARGMLVPIGNTLVRMDSLEAARSVFDEAETAMTEAGDTPGLASLYLSRGVLAVRVEPGSALQWFERALFLSRELPGGERIRSNALNNIADELVWEYPDSALSLYGLALELDRGLNRQGEAPIVLRNIAHAYHRVIKPARLEIATAYYDSAATTVARVGRWAGSDLNQLAFAETRAELFGYWARAWAARAEDPAIGTRRAATAALGAADRGRATVLSGLLGIAAPDTLPGLDLAVRADSLLRGLRLPENEVAIYYLTTPDTLMTWLILPGGEVILNVQPIPRTWLQERIERLRTAFGIEEGCVISEPPRDFPTALLDELSAALFPPEIRTRLAGKVGLLLLPHGPLNRLPFAVLPVGSSRQPLGLAYALRYSPSLAISSELAEGTPFPRVLAQGRALVVGNPEMPRISLCGVEYTPQRLGASERSSDNVAGLLHVRPLTGGAATESAVRMRIPDASVVYLATHAFAYESQEEARNSFVALTPEQGNDPEHDGKLTVAEILDELPPLQADLVALATCRSGLGQLHEGEGTVGLQRALLARGARSVLVSLWDVDDDASEVLLNEFFRRWIEEGLSKAESLKQAQAVVASQPRWTHPRFWAAYQLAGGN